MTYRDPATLPKWAQRQMELLKQKLDEARAQLAEHHATSGKTRVWYDGDKIGDRHYIPHAYAGRDSDITFQLGEDAISEQVRVALREDFDGKLILDINAGTTVAIEPKASNCFRVRLTR